MIYEPYYTLDFSVAAKTDLETLKFDTKIAKNIKKIKDMYEGSDELEIIR